MTREELIKLKEDIAKLSEDDQKKRDLYLRELALGHIEGPPTGYRSIDKVWLKHYTEDDIMSSIPKRRLYEDLVSYNKNNLNEIAIEYFGSKITYKSLIDNIDRVASSLVQTGVKKGDIVSVCLPYLPETVYLIYALNKIGAIVNMIDPRINDQLIADYIGNANSKYVFIIDKIEKKMERIMSKIQINQVVSISPLYSHGNGLLRGFSSIKGSKYIKWNDFFNMNLVKTEVAEYNDQELAVIEYTSGTSGIPKGVMLPNESFNSLAYFQFQCLKNKVGDKFLLIMPPFIAYGLVVGMHDMLCQGQHLLMVPSFTLEKAPELLPKLVDKYHPDYIMGVPNFLAILMKYNKKLSLKGMIVGGDHLDPAIEKRGRAFFSRSDSTIGLYKGWGMTEIASCGAFTKTDIPNKIGSVGIPLSKSNVMLLKRREYGARYDINEPEITGDEDGILFTSSPAAMLGYYHRDDATNEVIYVDNQGVKWVNTGDVFHIDEDGYLFFRGREKRIVVRPDGHNIPANQIEGIGNGHPLVDTAVVVGVPSRKYSHGNNAVLCLSLNDKNITENDLNTVLNDIKKQCYKQLQPRDRAKYFIVLDEIPYTMNGKVDYRKLTTIAQEKIVELNKDEGSQDVFYIIDEHAITPSKVLKLRKDDNIMLN